MVTGACFSKVPKLFGHISGSLLRSRLSGCLETPSFWRYKENYVTRNVVSFAAVLRDVTQRGALHETLQLFLFLFPLQHMKRRALQNRQVGVLRMAFQDFRETGPGSFCAFIIYVYIHPNVVSFTACSCRRGSRKVGFKLQSFPYLFSIFTQASPLLLLVNEAARVY